MGKPTGFLDYERRDDPEREALARTEDYLPLHTPLAASERQMQAGRCMDCGTPFCQAGLLWEGRRLGCPLHNLIPEWNDLLWARNPAQALRRLLKTNCLPEFTGRVCPALCEDACICGLTGHAPVTVRENELSIIEYGFANGLMAPQPPRERSGRAVAVVGSGPAGLAAAWMLNRRGHTVTVLEKDKTPGGLLTYGIPEMKLPAEIVARRVALMEAEGVKFVTGLAAGADVEPQALSDAYDAVIFCCGAQKPRAVPMEGERLSGVVTALDYLRAEARMSLREEGAPLTAKKKAVAVVGAGNTASDCVATALRQGCSSLIQPVRRPASDYAGAEDYARKEAMAVFGSDPRRFETTVKKALPGPDGALGALLLKTPAGEESVPCDLLILASGFSGPEDGAAAAYEAVRSRENVFCAGDMKNGASLVVLAIADGRRAAADADSFLMGYTNLR